MKKLIASVMFGALLVVGVLASTNHETDTAMEVEPTVFSMDVQAPAGSLY